jgi:outer membrane protein assembly factor BamB
MFKKILKSAAVVVVVVALAGVVLYFFGLRVVLDGGGGPHFAFMKTNDEKAADLEKHRETQRAQQLPGSAAPAKPSVPSEPLSKLAPLVPDPSGPTYWTDFRGPRRDGHYRERPIKTQWPSAGLTPLWKQPVGGGYASFVIANGRAFTIEQRGKQEVAAAYDVRTGVELWTSKWDAVFRESMGGDGPRATPTWNGGEVYVLGATGELRALDEKTGRTIWRTNILEDAGAENLQWGMSAAPLVVGSTVVVLPGGPNGQSVVAYDRGTGKRVWSALDDKASYSSPMLVELAGVRQILTFTASRLVGLEPDTGALLWEFPWKTQYEVNASQPLIVAPNRVFVSTGYGTGAAVIELTRGGDGRLTPREVWKNIRMKNQFTSSVLHDGFIYGLDESILACVDPSNGDLMWKGGRYGYGQLLLASGHLIVLTEGGDLAIVKAHPGAHVELAKFHALAGPKSWNHPAMTDGILLIRNDNEMAAFDLRR